MAPSSGYALFETPIGTCGIAWTARGVVSVQLPERTPRATAERIARRAPGAAEVSPPAPVRRAIDAITALLGGEPRDLSDVVLDMDGIPPFHRRVYDAARRIGPGRTLSYGDVARALGEPGAARAVGQALGKNPFAIVVPCHRVVAAGGRMGGFSAHGGVSTKQRLLAIETGRAGDDGGRS